MGDFFFFWVTRGQNQSNYLNSGNFLGHFRVTSRLPEINCRKKHLPKVWGGPWPPWPPPGYATDTDAIPAEVYKHHRGDTLLQKLTDLFCRMWDEEVISQQLKDASIVHLYQKGNRQLCDNYGGISLQAIAGKILARVLLNRLIVHLEHGLLPESQCGFRGGRGTVDMIFAMATEVGLQNRWRSVQPQTTQSKDKGDGSHTERTPL